MSRSRKSRKSSAKRRRHHNRISPLTRRLRFEPLEDRRMLAVITVDSLDDNLFPGGGVTLREAIVAANTNTSVDGSVAGSVGADTILFDATLFATPQTITLGAELAITEALTIDATALANNITIDANNASRIFNITATTGNFTLAGLSLTGGLTTGDNVFPATTFSGGAVRSLTTGILTIDQSTVSGNNTMGSGADGGGIFASGNVILLSSTVSGNTTEGTFASGGGIRTSSGDVMLTSSTVSGNVSAGRGGGIRTSSGAVTLTNSTVSGNNSFANGGGIWTLSGVVMLTSSTVSGNNTTGSNGRGGGIYTSSGAVTLTSSTVSGNDSDNDGGGILTSSGAVTLTSSTVSGNSTMGSINANGGGIWTSSGDVTLTSSTVSGNVSGAVGGGIFTSSGAVTLSSSTVTGNSAGVAGGGIFVDNTASDPVLTIENSIVAGNTDDGTAADLLPDPDTTLTANFSLLGTAVTPDSGSGNQFTDTPLLGTLANNGGPTETHALLIGSLAIDMASPLFDVVATPNDQRGVPFARGVGARVDIGAYERQTVAGLNLTVDTNVDESDGDYSAGDLSLREAVGLANGSIGADTITFAAALSGQTITLGGTELQITEALTIDATSLAANVTIDANSQSRVLNFTASTGDLTLSGLTITGGLTTGSSDGGGIRFGSNGTLTLNSSTVSDNTSADGGGGIHTFGGNVTLTNSTVSGNTSLQAGGGIYTIVGALTLTDSTVSGNITTGIFGNGGGISTSFGAVTLTGSTVSGNSTSGTFGNGGGIFTSSGVVTLTSSTVSGNESNASGGGIWTTGYVTLTDSTVSGNISAARGGGIRTSSGAVTLTDSTISGNSSADFGGGIYTYSGAVTLTGSTVSGNSTTEASADGGGIWTRFGDVMLTSSTVSGNESGGSGGGIWTLSGVVMLTSSTVSGNISAASGGGIFASSGDVTIANSIVAGNTAVGVGPDLSSGGTLNIDFSLIGVEDGLTITGSGNQTGTAALPLDPLLGPLANNGGPTETHALLAGSLAIDIGGTTVLTFDQRGAPFTREADGDGDSVIALDAGAFEVPLTLIVTTLVDEDNGTGDVSLREAIGTANSSSGVPNNIVFDASLSGLTIILGGTELQITDTLTIDATALASGVTIDADMQSRVLNFTATTGDLTLSGLTITGGLTTGSSDGGGIRFGSNGTLALNSSTVSGNTSGFRGGGIYTVSGAVTLTDSTVSGNITTGIFGNGGGISTIFGDVTLTDSTVSGNTAMGTSTDGGGIRASSGDVTLTDSTVSGNTSADDGGGIFTSSGDVTLTDSTVSGNTSADDGGGIFTSSGDVTLTSSTVSENMSDDDGGGIRTSSGDVTLTNSTVSGNSSSFSGGGIRTFSGAVTLTSSTVTGNSAGGAGGGVYVFDSSTNSTLTIENSIVAGNTDDGTGPDLVPDPDSTLNVDFSLIGVTDGLTITGGGNLTGTAALPLDPLLGPLTDNGGPTETHALLPGSLAIDAANSILTTDQRGQSVPIDLPGVVNAAGGNGSDIGAYEVQIAVDSADFDDDGDIDGFDFLTWQRGFGSATPAMSDGDADNDGNVDADDLSIWETQFGGPAPLAAVAELSAVSYQPSALSDTPAVLVPAFGRRAELIDAAIAVEWLRSGQVAETAAIVEEPAFAETYANQVFAAEAAAPAGLFAGEYELAEANSGEVDTAESPWLADELLERVFA